MPLYEPGGGVTMPLSQSVTFDADGTYDVGSTTERAANVYTGSLDASGGITSGGDIDATGHDIYGADLFLTGSITNAEDPITLLYTADLHLNGLVRQFKNLTPTLTADVNDWAPTGIGATSQVYPDLTGGPWTITGITGVNGQELVLLNYDATDNIVLANDDAASAAANRILTGSGDLIVRPGHAVTMRYNTSRWRVHAHNAVPSETRLQGWTAGHYSIETTSITDVLTLPANVTTVRIWSAS